MEVYAYSVMSNRFHIVLRNHADWTQDWSDEEGARRWLNVFPVRHTTADGFSYETEPQDIADIVDDSSRVSLLRERLSDVSWF